MDDKTIQIIKSGIAIIIVIVAFNIINNTELFWGMFLLLFAHKIADHKDK